MKWFIVISLCFIRGSKSALLNKEEGEKCNLVDEEDWICQHPENCPQIGDVRMSRPDICSFKGKVPIICCPGDKSQREPTLNIGNVPSTDDDTPSKNADDVKPPASTGTTPGSPPIALMKCIEYEVKICRNMLREVGIEKTRLIRDTSQPFMDDQRVVKGGQSATSNQFPFMATIGYGKSQDVRWECAGTIISEYWILSAAHCAHTKSGEAKWIGLGSEKIYPKLNGLQIPISKIMVHPLYKPPAMYHDIALFQLDSGVVFNSFVRPMCLYALKVLPRYAVATGWDYTSLRMESSDLFHFDMINANAEMCEQEYNNGTSTLLPHGYNNEIMFCSGEVNKKSCSGVSGDAIFFNSSICLHVQIGVSSFRQTSCGAHPTVYTRISYYLPWIENIIWPNAKPEPFFT